MTTSSGHTSAILASRVKGTAVYDGSGDKIGTVEDVVLDKTSNRIMFAALGFGGVLGLGEAALLALGGEPLPALPGHQGLAAPFSFLGPPTRSM